MDSAFFAIGSLPATPPAQGIVRRAANAGRAMMTFFTFAAGAEVPLHTHVHDQLSVVIRGRAEFEVAGETRILGPGEGASIPSNTPHRVRILDGEAEIWDAWAPLREEYLTVESAACAAAAGKFAGLEKEP